MLSITEYYVFWGGNAIPIIVFFSMRKNAVFKDIIGVDVQGGKGD